MATTSPSNLLQPGQAGGSGSNVALWLENYSGEFLTTLYGRSVFNEFFKFKTLTGTHASYARYMGSLTISEITRGADLPVQTTEFSKKTVTVEKPVGCRVTIDLLTHVQNDFNEALRIGAEQGAALADFRDRAWAIALLRAATEAARTSPARVGGTTVTATASGDTDDAAKFLALVKSLVIQMKEKNAFIPGEMCLFMSPSQAGLLRENEKLVSSLYSTGNADYAGAMLKGVEGVKVIETNALPSAVASHPLSTSGNSNLFNITASDLKCKALLAHPSAVFGAEAIPPKTKVWVDPGSENTNYDVLNAFTIGTADSAFSGCIKDG